MTDNNTQIIERLARIEEKQDALLYRSEQNDLRIADLDVRVRALESGNSKLLGMGALVAFVASIGGGKLLEIFTK